MAKDKDKDVKPKQEAQQQPKAPKKEARNKDANVPKAASGPQLPAPPARRRPPRVRNSPRRQRAWRCSTATRSCPS